MCVRNTIGGAVMMLLLGAGLGLSETSADNQAPEKTVLVVIETAHGIIEVELYPDRAPLSAAQFLAHVNAHGYAGASLYRVTSESRGASIEVVQGGLLADAMRQSLEAYSQGSSALPPVAHESTDLTGMRNERGTIAFARLAPGSANSEFFFNIQDNPELDSGYTQGGRDGYGYATFGRVVRGMDLLQEIQQMRSETPTPIERVQGQILNEPVRIERMYLANSAQESAHP